MPTTLAQDVSWPGVLAVETLAGTVSHGITPGTFVLVTYPQTAQPAEYGTLAFGDGIRRVVLPDCKVTGISGQAAGDGQVWILRIEDRRWRWPGLGTISGHYNRVDERGKLVPWTIRSPEELCRLCLAAMGENPATYRLIVPPGLTSQVGANVDRYLELGENFRQSITNPEVIWDNTPPAEALARLVEQFQCRLIYQPNLNRVLVAPLGRGRALPPGPCEVIAPAVNAPIVPRRVGIVGAPIRIQCRVPLEAVGKEWDGSFRPVNDLSYKPPGGWKNCLPPTFAAVVATDRLSYFEAVSLAQESVFRCFRVRNIDPGQPMAKGPLALPWFGKLKRRHQIILQPTKAEQVVPAPRGNVGQAGNAGAFATSGIRPEFYNGYSRDQQAVVYGRVDKACVNQVTWVGPPVNTKATDKVRVSFAIDPMQQVVTFAEPVWRRDTFGNGESVYSFPSLVLETAVLVTHQETGAFIRYEQSYPVAGGRGPDEWQSRDDVQISIVGDYTVTESPSLSQPDDRHVLKGFRFLDLADAIPRADYYAKSLADKYQLTGGGTNQYVGIVPIDPDGFIQQVSWGIGAGGPSTTASGNSEHSAFVLPYPDRRRNENLRPNAAAAAANLNERQAAKKLLPRPPGDPRP